MQEIDRILRSQFGVISRHQALNAGMPVNRIRYLVRTRNWIVVHTGVYRIPSVPQTLNQRLMAVTLWTDGVVSHDSAAWLHGLELFRRPSVSVTVAHGVRRRWSGGDVVVHQARNWNALVEGTVVRSQLLCTGVERTIIDCGTLVSPIGVVRLVEDAARRNLTTWPRVEDALNEIGATGKPGAGTVRAAIESQRAAQCPVPLSEFSRLVASMLVDAGLPAPQLEYVIRDGEGGHILQVDLAWPELRRAWELDGWQFHSTRSDWERDKSVRNLAKLQGWVIQEITWRMFEREPEQLIEMARRFLSV